MLVCEVVVGMGGCDCGLEDVAEKRFGWLFNFFIGAVFVRSNPGRAGILNGSFDALVRVGDGRSGTSSSSSSE